MKQCTHGKNPHYCVPCLKKMIEQQSIKAIALNQKRGSVFGIFSK